MHQHTSPSALRIAVLVTFAIFCSASSCTGPKQRAEPDLTEADQARVREITDSLEQAMTNDIWFDTVGVSSGPVKILKASVYEDEYSSYKKVRINYQNVSEKQIEAIRFSWHGYNVFGEPAQFMIGGEDGFGGGFTEHKIPAGKKDVGAWNTYSTNARTIDYAWPIEVVFSDGSKWKSQHK